jgi:putative transposase
VKIEMIAQRVEKHCIKKNNPMWSICDDLCFRAKDMFNYANYIQRQKFIAERKIYKVNELDKLINKSEPYTRLGSQASQRLLKQLDNAWKSFFVAIKDYSKNPRKYLGKPKLPSYKDKKGRYICEIKNIQFRIENEFVVFSWYKLKPFSNIIKTDIKSKPMSMRIIPKGSCYTIEIIYRKEAPEPKEFNNRILGIDLGVDNLTTCVNNVGVQPIIINGKVVKSINQYYNKKHAILKSDLKKRHNKDWSKRLQKLINKRNNKIEYYMHCTSKSIIEYCKGLDINTIVIGLNKTWKQESSLIKSANQNFVAIPYDKLINMIKYKAEDIGITVITNEESYTSGCSFLDNEVIGKDSYNKSRRIMRGLFKSNKGILINSDVNGAYNIMKKVFSEAFRVDEIEGVGLHPVRVSIAC